MRCSSAQMIPFLSQVYQFEQSHSWLTTTWVLAQPYSHCNFIEWSNQGILDQDICLQDRTCTVTIEVPTASICLSYCKVWDLSYNFKFLFQNHKFPWITCCFYFYVFTLPVSCFLLRNIQILKEFLTHSEAEVRSLASLYSNVVCIKFCFDSSVLATQNVNVSNQSFFFLPPFSG